MSEKEQPPPYSPQFQQAPPPGFHTPMPQPPLQQVHPQPIHTVFIAPVALGPHSQSMVCPSCHASIQSTVETEPNTKTHLFALLLCVFGCIPCCCIPYCMDSCQSQKHSCPACGAYLGTHVD